MKPYIKLELLVEQSKTHQIFCLSDSGKYLYYISYGKVNSLKKQNISNDEIEVKIECPDFMVLVRDSKICLSYDDRYCCVGFERKNIGNQLARFDLKQKKFLDIIQLQNPRELADLQFIPNIYKVLALCGGITFVDFETKQSKFIPEPFEKVIKSISFFQNYKKLISLDNFFQIQLINLENDRLPQNFYLRRRINFFQVKPISDGQIFLARNQQICMFSTQFRKLLRKIPRYMFSGYVLFSEKQIYFLTQNSTCIVEVDSCKQTIHQIDMPIDFIRAELAKKASSVAIGGLSEIYIIQHMLNQY